MRGRDNHAHVVDGGVARSAADSKRGPASLPAPVSPDFGHTTRRTCHLVSAACSTRAGKGMRASRRSPGSGCASEEASHRSRRPASPLPGALTKPCWILGPMNPPPPPLARPLRPLASGSACAAPSAGASDPLARLVRPGNFQSSFEVRPLRELPPPLARRLHFRSPEYPRLARLWFPEGTCTLPIRVSSWLCSGFPRRHRLLTVMRLSLNRGAGKRQMAPRAC